MRYTNKMTNMYMKDTWQYNDDFMKAVLQIGSGVGIKPGGKLCVFADCLPIMAVETLLPICFSKSRYDIYDKPWLNIDTWSQTILSNIEFDSVQSWLDSLGNHHINLSSDYDRLIIATDEPGKLAGQILDISNLVIENMMFTNIEIQ